MTSRGGPDFSSPALDFLATIRAKERLGAFAILDEGDRDTLEDLLRRYHAEGATRALEREARTFLISYREMDKHAGVLDREERDRLGAILDGPPGRGSTRDGDTTRGGGAFAGQHGTPGSEPPGRSRLSRARWFIAAGVCVLAAGAGTGSYIASHQSGPPPAAVAQHPVVPNVPPESTDLQKLRQDYGPWQQLAPSGQRPATGAPALLLLEAGAYFASQRWTISPTAASGWQNDLGGTVASVTVNGGSADITDADGNSYIVGINQPFIISGNPATVLLIDPAGAVRSMSLAHATAVRHPLGMLGGSDVTGTTRLFVGTDVRRSRGLARGGSQAYRTPARTSPRRAFHPAPDADAPVATPQAALDAQASRHLGQDDTDRRDPPPRRPGRAAIRR